MYCPSGLYLCQASLNLRVSLNKQLIPSFTKTNSIYSLFYSTVNSLPSVVVQLVSIRLVYLLNVLGTY